jgi:phosphate uptake regulator
MLYRFIGAVYKSGYEQVKIIFNTPKQLETIYDVLRKTCLGFEIIEQSKNFIIIKEISKPEHHEFENVLRRNFLFLLSVANDSLDSVKKQDFEELKNITLRDHNINKYSDFCRRLLNKKSISEKNSPLYHIVEQMEKIGDIYRDLCLYVSENKLKIDKEIIDIYAKVNEFLTSFYETFYKFNFSSIEEFGKKRNEIHALINKSFNSKNNDKHILFFLNNVFNTVFDLNGALMTYHL